MSECNRVCYQTTAMTQSEPDTSGLIRESVLSRVKIKDRNYSRMNLTQTDIKERFVDKPTIFHKNLDSLVRFMGAFQTYYPHL